MRGGTGVRAIVGSGYLVPTPNLPGGGVRILLHEQVVTAAGCKYTQLLQRTKLSYNAMAEECKYANHASKEACTRACTHTHAHAHKSMHASMHTHTREQVRMSSGEPYLDVARGKLIQLLEHNWLLALVVTCHVPGVVSDVLVRVHKAVEVANGRAAGHGR